MPTRKKPANSPRSKKAEKPKSRPAATSRQIAEDFQERQDLNQEGSDKLAQRLKQHTSLSPKISAGDIDARWEDGRQSGEETFTGHAPTPDQDVVDDLGEAAGLTYKDDEPLQVSKVAKRDKRRYELEPRSAEAAEDSDDEDEEDDDDTDSDDAPLRFWDLADDLDAEVEEEDDEEDDEDDAETDTVLSVDDEEMDDDEADLEDGEDFDDEDELDDMDDDEFDAGEDDFDDDDGDD